MLAASIRGMQHQSIEPLPETSATEWQSLMKAYWEMGEVRESAWKVAPIPADFRDRRVEITGPVERKMMINALNSGAKVFMADFEDSNSPTWENVVRGQQNLTDAIERTISFETPEKR